MKPIFPRRRFIAAVCAAAAAAAFPLAAASRAMARVMGMKQHMLGRMAAPYREDAASERRFPQQNSQLCKMSGLYPGMPENAEELFRTSWTDRSANLDALRASGAYPGPRAAIFRRLPYPHEEE